MKTKTRENLGRNKCKKDWYGGGKPLRKGRELHLEKRVYGSLGPELKVADRMKG